MTPTTQRAVEIRRLTLHFLEMVVAMLVGMVALGPVWSLVPGVPTTVEVDALVMATDMAIGMALWMRIRGHAAAGITEMCATMYVAFLILLVPYWAGLIDGSTAITGGHILMLPLMLVSMLRHRGPGDPAVLRRAGARRRA